MRPNPDPKSPPAREEANVTDETRATPPAAIDRGPNELREIKVKLPLWLHIRLHALKLTKGTSISSVVLEALDKYLKEKEK